MNPVTGPLSGAYETLFHVVLFVLAAMILLCMIRAVKGPTIADRIVAVNMVGTQVIIIIAVLAYLMGEDYLADVSLVYAMISFLAVIVLCKVYMGVYLEKKSDQNKEEKQL